jgi:Cof subfamily protein (haloacid dehalogenase superfamily)
MPIKMIALDLDGTLALDNHQVSPATRAELKKLHESGVEVVIATGRRYRTTRFVIDNLGFDVYAVCNGGALVKTPDSVTHYETTYSTSQLNDLVAIAREQRLALFGQRDAHDRGGPDFIIDDEVTWCNLTQSYFDENNNWSGKGDLFNSKPEILVAGVMGNEEQLRVFTRSIEESFPGVYNHIVVPWRNSEAFYSEITLANIDKWHGLSQLANLFNIEAKNICAVGDQVNDIPMLMEVAHGVAMGNGVEALQAHAKFTCGNYDEDGILEVIDYIRHHNAGIQQQ